MIEQLFKFNCSTLFLLYPLGLNRRKLGEFGFISSYLSDQDKEPSCPFPVLLLFRPDDMEKMQRFIEDEYKRTDNLMEDYDYEGGYVVLVYKWPVKWKEDYQKFIDGRYSKFSKDVINSYPKTIEVADKNGVRREEFSSQYQIIRKTNEWKEMIEEDLNIHVEGDQEYWQKPDKERETLDISKFKSLSV